MGPQEIDGNFGRERQYFLLVLLLLLSRWFYTYQQLVPGIAAFRPQFPSPYPRQHPPKECQCERALFPTSEAWVSVLPGHSRQFLLRWWCPSCLPPSNNSPLFPIPQALPTDDPSFLQLSLSWHHSFLLLPPILKIWLTSHYCHGNLFLESLLGHWYILERLQGVPKFYKFGYYFPLD